MSPFTTLIKVTDSLCGIRYYVTVVGKCTFDININSALPLTPDEMNYCFEK